MNLLLNLKAPMIPNPQHHNYLPYLGITSRNDQLLPRSNQIFSQNRNSFGSLWYDPFSIQSGLPWQHLLQRRRPLGSEFGGMSPYLTQNTTTNTMSMDPLINMTLQLYSMQNQFEYQTWLQKCQRAELAKRVQQQLTSLSGVGAPVSRDVNTEKEANRVGGEGKARSKLNLKVKEEEIETHCEVQTSDSKQADINVKNEERKATPSCGKDTVGQMSMTVKLDPSLLIFDVNDIMDSDFERESVDDLFDDEEETRGRKNAKGKNAKRNTKSQKSNAGRKKLKK